MNIKETIQKKITEITKELYGQDFTLEVQQNKTEFAGDFTVVIFPLVKAAKKSPDVLGSELGEALKKKYGFRARFQCCKRISQSFG